MTIKECLSEAKNYAKKSGKYVPSLLEIELLLSNILEKPRYYLIAHGSEDLSDTDKNKFFIDMDRLLDSVPLQYIIKKQEFMGLSFFVDENVLIPREDTEILVLETVNYLKTLSIKNPKVLDMCTGSGCIAISLAKSVKNLDITAVDISSKALDIAKKNAELNGIENINFIESDLFEKIDINDRYDVIVSNPPYIAEFEVETLDKRVKNEPMLALCGGEDGLDFYKKILDSAYKIMKPDSILILEIGYSQAKELKKIYEFCNNYYDFKVIKDFSNNDRVVCMKNGG